METSNYNIYLSLWLYSCVKDKFHVAPMTLNALPLKLHSIHRMIFRTSNINKCRIDRYRYFYGTLRCYILNMNLLNFILVFSGAICIQKVASWLCITIFLVHKDFQCGSICKKKQNFNVNSAFVVVVVSLIMESNNVRANLSFHNVSHFDFYG